MSSRRVKVFDPMSPHKGKVSDPMSPHKGKVFDPMSPSYLEAIKTRPLSEHDAEEMQRSHYDFILMDFQFGAALKQHVYDTIT
ncbi:hypothetical protein ACOMHN_014777 [Nucella lapillus]